MQVNIVNGAIIETPIINQSVKSSAAMSPKVMNGESHNGSNKESSLPGGSSASKRHQLLT